MVPYRSSCRYRDRAWGWVRARYQEQHPDWKVTVAEPQHGDWSKASALMPAIARSSADVIVVADADVWVNNLDQAVDAIKVTGWAVPHRWVLRLSDRSTRNLLAGVDDVEVETVQRPYVGWIGGGLVVIRRDLALEIPMDPRFLFWGGEDESWGYALQTLAGRPWRGKAPLMHLWHPPAERMSRRMGTEANDKLCKRYMKARTDPVRMAAIVKEAQQCLSKLS